MHLLAGTVAAVLLILSAIHIYWAFAGAGAGAAVPSNAEGAPVFRPGPVSTLAVALALAVAALLVLARAGLISPGLPPFIVTAGTWAVAAVFGARTIGEFRYVGIFRRVRGTPFARWDAWLFTPLCAALALGTGWLASS